jgi:hypothetical protein
MAGSLNPTSSPVVKVPTSNPVYAGLRSCNLCGYGLEVTRPKEFVEFENRTLSGTCKSFEDGTLDECIYYSQRQRYIISICGCTPSHSNFGSAPAMNELSLLYFVLIGSLTMLIVCGLCFWRAACLRRSVQQGTQTGIAAQPEETATRPTAVPISRQESDHDSRMRRSRVLMFLFPTDRKVRLTAWLVTDT